MSSIACQAWLVIYLHHFQKGGDQLLYLKHFNNLFFPFTKLDVINIFRTSYHFSKSKTSKEGNKVPFPFYKKKFFNSLNPFFNSDNADVSANDTFSCCLSVFTQDKNHHLYWRSIREMDFSAASFPAYQQSFELLIIQMTLFVEFYISQYLIKDALFSRSFHVAYHERLENFHLSLLSCQKWLYTWRYLRKINSIYSHPHSLSL